jgi:hypothetical protein
MASEFIPDLGMLFMVESTCVLTQEVNIGGVAVMEKFKSGSYKTDVFRCKATDARTVVADMVLGVMLCVHGEAPIILLKRDYNFYPVGPDVAAALGLEM